MTFDDEQAREWLDDLDAGHAERMEHVDRFACRVPGGDVAAVVREWRALVEQDDRPRCGGSGELVERLTPQLDYRDPDNVTREYECPGCPDCMAAASVQKDGPA